jgi:hypothetical protein
MPALVDLEEEGTGPGIGLTQTSRLVRTALHDALPMREQKRVGPEFGRVVQPRPS